MSNAPIIALSGYGISVTVEHGYLCVEDGVGNERRSARFARANSGIKRVVVLGHSGIISFEALRWLSGIGASFIHIDNDAEIITASGVIGLDDARLRRAQAAALNNGIGLAIARDLMSRKLKGQIDVLGWFQNPPSLFLKLKIARAKAREADSIDELRFAEGEGARAYWYAWRTLPVRFKCSEVNRVPEHWLTFGSRSSPLSRPSPRRAVNPANALLNYVYAIVEAETRIASIAVGLDPAIGLMHSDLRARDSLACDLMEAIRPQADEFVLELIKNRVFKKADFFETREGICRLLPPLNREIAETADKWRKLIGPVAEEVAQKLFKAKASSKIQNSSLAFAKYRLPTPLTGINRSIGRMLPIESIESTNGTNQQSRKTYSKRPSLKLDCIRCGKQIDGKHRMYCNLCLSG
jgi:CRISPR-associated endonuclease Cas1